MIAYGDGMNDYYMLKQADKGFLKTKSNGEVSRSLRVSKNSFVGSNVKRQEGGKGPDTTMRLFNLI